MWNPQGPRKRGRPGNSWRRSWEKELEGVETYCQRQEKMELVDNICS
jgi:hypothetical protein